MLFHGFPFLKLLGLKARTKERIGADELGAKLAQIVVECGGLVAAEDFLKIYEVIHDTTYSQVFYEEFFHLNAWAIEFSIQVAFCKKPKLRDKLSAKYLNALNTEQQKMQLSGPYYLSNVTDRWLNRKKKYNENLKYGIETIPSWFFDIVRDRLGIPPNEGLNWVGKQGRAYDGLKLTLLTLVRNQLASFNSLKKEVDIY
jgi:hypothetical protein